MHHVPLELLFLPFLRPHITVTIPLRNSFSHYWHFFLYNFLVLFFLYCIFHFHGIACISDFLIGLLLWRYLLSVLLVRDCPSRGNHQPVHLISHLYYSYLPTLFPRLSILFPIVDFLFAFRFLHIFDRSRHLFNFIRFLHFDTAFS